MGIATNLEQVRKQIEDVNSQYQRELGAVRLLAVSKTKPIADIITAYESGQRLFGENYVQEAIDKCAALSHLEHIEWHFIGPIQSNKSRLVAENLDWVHTLDREKIAIRLSEQRPESLAPLNVCIQVNISGEETKSGVHLEELQALVDLVISLPNLQLRGLMAIPAPQSSEDEQIRVYQPLLQAYKSLQAQLPNIDTLSIGMSGDMEAAIASGSTMVRIGTAIFGSR
ncbi:YggS family pyridoxal phosphate-dependent enzyme [Marinomonas sp. 15G1-11]|uniref:Pyridoxal phosphate homeostasis protein n=1 Tax=Marinomonas phaeophyticola TaxID=3004091 RepID=A0ABT4JWM7_9GAMM|nr:YggS family pyridoxal phosphate-dependent enzyme [Marinomonas sp. 15G1-11]MCZ2722621.1 YggS family pyridoxal phosphate-dependent enzyme [Marinomonas sp. 15G1-11]